MTVAPYRLEAYNTAKFSENKMHDDTVAKQYGFSGGLVTGVDLFAYLVHLPVSAYGRAFLERGQMEASFIKPVYDGEQLTLEADEIDGGLAIRLQSRGEVCGLGTASLPDSAPEFKLADYPETTVVAQRPPVTAASFAMGQWLGTEPAAWPLDAAAAYADDVRERDEIYTREGLVHPGVIQRLMNRVLVENVVLGPWIHVGSKMQLLSPVGIGDVLTVRAKVVQNYEKKGHRFAEFDALVLANGVRPVAHCHHTAIFQPRQKAAA